MEVDADVDPSVASEEREELQIITTGHNHTEPPSQLSVGIVKSY